MFNHKKIDFIFFEDSWNKDYGKEQEDQAGLDRRGEIFEGGVEPTSPTPNDTEKPRG